MDDMIGDGLQEMGRLKIVGRFTLKDGLVSGPKTYMEERGFAIIHEIQTGHHEVFNEHFLIQALDAEMAVLVYLQTDYAGWLGEQEMLGWLAPREVA